MVLGLGEIRPGRTRFFFIAFWTLVLSFHLRVFTTGGLHDGSWLLVLALGAVVAACAIMIAHDRQDTAGSRTQHKAVRSPAEPILARQIEAELGRSHHAHGPVGLMIVEVDSILRSSGEALAEKHRVLAVVDELIEHYLDPGYKTFRSGKYLALIVRDSRPAGMLERVADRLERDARAWLSGEPNLRHFQLVIGIAASQTLKGTGADLIQRASIAMSRAKVLGSSQYTASDRLV